MKKLKVVNKIDSNVDSVDFGSLPLFLRMGLFPYFIKALGFIVAMRLLFHNKKEIKK